MKWQIITLANLTKFTGLGNFGTVEISSQIPVLVNEKCEILAIPGLIGGKSSKAESDSLDLILEVANFEAEMVARSAAKTNYRSDASRIWAGQVKPNLRDLFQIHLIQILNLWKAEAQKLPLKNPEILENKSEENLKNTNQRVILKNTLENQKLETELEIKDLKTKNYLESGQLTGTLQNQNSQKIVNSLWQIKTILKWQKDLNSPKNLEKQNLESQNLPKNLVLVELGFETKAKNEKSQNFQNPKNKKTFQSDQSDLQSQELMNLDNSNKFKTSSDLESKNTKNIQEIGNQKTQNEQTKSKNNLENGLKIDFEYLAARLDGQSADFWRPKLIQKMNLVGFFEDETWFGNIFYGNIRTLEQLLIEMIRLIGFKSLKPQLLSFTNNWQKMEFREFALKQQIKKLAVKNGFVEVITRPFVSEKVASLCPGNFQKILNPYNSNFPVLRNSVLPSLLQIAAENLNRGLKNPLIVEQNQIFTSQGLEIQKKEILAMIAVQDNPYLLTTFVHELTQKLGFNNTFTTFEKINEACGQITIYNLKNINKAPNNYEKKLETPNYTQNLDEKLYKDQNSGLENNLSKVQNSIKLIQVSNAFKKEFGIPLLKTVWYLEIEIDINWQFKTFSNYFDESEFPSVMRDYSLETGKSWQQINQIINEIPREFELRVWPVSYWKTNTEKESVIVKSETNQNELPSKSEPTSFEKKFTNNLQKESKNKLKNPKISFKVKMQSKNQTLTKNQVENWEKQMLQLLE